MEGGPWLRYREAREVKQQMRVLTSAILCQLDMVGWWF